MRHARESLSSGNGLLPPALTLIDVTGESESLRQSVEIHENRGVSSLFHSLRPQSASTPLEAVVARSLQRLSSESFGLKGPFPARMSSFPVSSDPGGRYIGRYRFVIGDCTWTRFRTTSSRTLVGTSLAGPLVDWDSCSGELHESAAVCEFVSRSGHQRRVAASPASCPQSQAGDLAFHGRRPIPARSVRLQAELADFFDKDLPESIRNGQRITTKTSARHGSRVPHRLQVRAARAVRLMGQRAVAAHLDDCR